MSGISENEINLLHDTSALRYQILDVITDADLAFRLPGDNVSLGELCSQMNAIQRAYIESFRTFKLDYALMFVPNHDAASVESLRAAFRKLDTELDEALTALTEDDVKNRMIERGFLMPVGGQFHTYREAVVIFCGKASIYLRALSKPIPQQFRDWIG